MSNGAAKHSKLDKYLAVLLAAAVGCIAAVLFVYGKHQANQLEDSSIINAEEAIESCFDKDGMIDPMCITEQIKSEVRTSFNTHNLRVQQDLAKWSLLMLIVTAFGVFFVALTLRETSKAVRVAYDANESARRQIRVTQEIGEKQIRAYPVIKEAGIKACTDEFSKLKSALDNTESFEFWINLENSGATPAYDLEVSTALKQTNGFCDVMPAKELCFPGITETVSAKGTSQRSQVFSLEKDGPRLYLYGASEFTPTKTGLLYFFGKVQYGDQNGRSFASYFVYQLDPLFLSGEFNRDTLTQTREVAGVLREFNVGNLIPRKFTAPIEIENIGS